MGIINCDIFMISTWFYNRYQWGGRSPVWCWCQQWQQLWRIPQWRSLQYNSNIPGDSLVWSGWWTSCDIQPTIHPVMRNVTLMMIFKVPNCINKTCTTILEVSLYFVNIYIYASFSLTQMVKYKFKLFHSTNWKFSRLLRVNFVCNKENKEPVARRATVGACCAPCPWCVCRWRGPGRGSWSRCRGRPRTWWHTDSRSSWSNWFLILVFVSPTCHGERKRWQLKLRDVVTSGGPGLVVVGITIEQ